MLPEGQSRLWLRLPALKNEGSWAYLAPDDNVYREHESCLQASHKNQTTWNGFRRLYKNKWGTITEANVD